LSSWESRTGAPAMAVTAMTIAPQTTRRPSAGAAKRIAR
jgi:hypothetical protein